jgi:hypothetical protein
MRKLAIFSLIAALCLGLSGCTVWDEVSHYFASVEDFVRGNPEVTTHTGGDGNGGGGGGVDTPTPHTLTVLSFKRAALEMLVVSKELNDNDEPVFSEAIENILPANGTDPSHYRVVENLYDGDYTLTLQTGRQPTAKDTVGDLETFRVEFTVKGSDLTVMLLVNEEPNLTGREVRAVVLPGSLEGVLVPEEE